MSTIFSFSKCYSTQQFFLRHYDYHSIQPSRRLLPSVAEYYLKNFKKPGNIFNHKYIKTIPKILLIYFLTFTDTCVISVHERRIKNHALCGYLEDDTFKEMMEADKVVFLIQGSTPRLVVSHWCI